MIYDRNLGRLEQAMEILNARATTWNVVTISRIKGSLNEGAIRQALDLVQCRHPRLNSHIVSSKNGSKFQTEGTEKIPLRVVEKIDIEKWIEVFYEEMNQKIDSNKYLLRVVVVHILSNSQVHFLITTAHHAIADALSCIQLHSEILTYSQKLLIGEKIQPFNCLTPLSSIEELIPEWTKTFKGKTKSLFFLLHLAFQKIWYRPKTLGFEEYLPISQRYSDVIHRQLDPELTQKFINRCRQENTTVNSALCAAMMFAVAHKIIKYNRKRICFNCLSYIDLRRHIKPPISDENMTVLATSSMGFYTIHTNTSFWQLAREVKQKLDSSIKQGNIFKMIFIAKYLIEFCFIYPQQVAATVSVSNVGKVKIPKVYGELELEEISFAGTHALYAGLFTVHASTFQEKMLLNFIFSRPSISPETMETLVNNVMAYIFNVSHFQYAPCLLDIQKGIIRQ